MVPHLVRFRPMSTTAIPVPPILATLIGRIAAAVPGRARATFTELLIGAAVTRGGRFCQRSRQQVLPVLS